MNGDDDNDNGVADRTEQSIAGKDDLIEVSIAQMDGAAGLVLRRSNGSIRVFGTPTKDNTLSFANNLSDKLQFTDDEATIFVEWSSNSHGSCSLTLEEASTGTVFDELRFSTFRTNIIVLGGENQSPSVPRVITDNDQGIFIMTDTFYENGHDVHLYHEDSVVNDNGNPRGTGIVFDDVAEAVSLRGVENVDILGYSHGGGSTYDLAWRIDHTDTATIQFTSYIDAIENDQFQDLESETLRPPGSQHHVNDWQPNFTGVF